MAVACLANLIGISSDCDTVAPDSGQFVNDLPGITLKVGDQIANEEDESGVAALQKNIDHAQTKMLQDIRGFLSPKMKTRSIIENSTVGHYVQNINSNVVASAAGEYRGIFIDINDRNYMSLHINSISLQLQDIVTTNIIISNAMNDGAFDNHSVTTVAGQPTTVIINQDYPIIEQRLQLLVFYDASVSNSFTTSLHGSGGCSSCTGKTYRNRMIDFRAVQMAQAQPAFGFTEQVLNTSSTTGGISINYSLKCDVVPFVCNMAEALALPLKYKSAIEMIQELKLSQRMNPLVIIHRDDYDLYQQELQEQYDNSMEQILGNVALPHDNLCFSCQQWVRQMVKIP